MEAGGGSRRRVLGREEEGLGREEENGMGNGQRGNAFVLEDVKGPARCELLRSTGRVAVTLGRYTLQNLRPLVIAGRCLSNDCLEERQVRLMIPNCRLLGHGFDVVLVVLGSALLVGGGGLEIFAIKAVVVWKKKNRGSGEWEGKAMRKGKKAALVTKIAGSDSRPSSGRPYTRAPSVKV